MRFLVDECTGPAVAAWLRSCGHEVFSVYEDARGMTDDEILDKARVENWILITNDRDFGAMIYRERRFHRGIVFLRLRDERASCKIACLEKLLDNYAARLSNAFVVASEARVRFAKT